MAKVRRIDDVASGTKSHVRIVFVDMEATDTTIHESVRAIAAAISGTAVKKTALLSTSPPAPVGNEQSGQESSTAGDSIPESDGAEPSVAQPQQPPRPRRKAPTPSIVEVKMKAGGEDLEQYLARYNPDSQLEKALVCVGWWRDELNVEEVGPDHLYTCFKLMKWTDGPNDYRVPFADMEHKKEWLTKGSRGFWKLNHIGEKELNRLEAAASGGK